jgi:hypothetical protein
MGKWWQGKLCVFDFGIYFVPDLQSEGPTSLFGRQKN